jgi:hypothetical protein
VFPISRGRSPRSGSACQEAEKIQSDLGTDEDQACRIWSLCASAREQTDWIAYGKVTTATRANAAARPEQMRHLSLQEQVNHLNQMLRGHYAYYVIAGNLQALQRVHRAVERYWRKMLSSRSWDGAIRWEQFQRSKEQFPLLRPKLYLPYRELQAIAIL